MGYSWTAGTIGALPFGQRPGAGTGRGGGGGGRVILSADGSVFMSHRRDAADLHGSGRDVEGRDGPAAGITRSPTCSTARSSTHWMRRPLHVPEHRLAGRRSPAPMTSPACPPAESAAARAAVAEAEAARELQRWGAERGTFGWSESALPFHRRRSHVQGDRQPSADQCQKLDASDRVSAKPRRARTIRPFIWPIRAAPQVRRRGFTVPTMQATTWVRINDPSTNGATASIAWRVIRASTDACMSAPSAVERSTVISPILKSVNEICQGDSNMRHGNIVRLTVLMTALLLVAGGSAGTGGGTPLMGLLDRFTAAGVPALGPAETAVRPRIWDKPIPAGLPGNGLAQHPMLYIGEGYNKMFLVNKGKIIWTYSTGTGYEYDDVWMLSNGNILFTRMQYVAEVTPKKEVVWRYDAPAGTEIHTLPADRPGQGHVRPERPAAQADRRQHQDQGRRSPARPARPEPDRRQDRPRAVPPRRATPRREPTWFRSWNMGQVVEYDKNFKEIWKYEIADPLGRHPPQERQHADHRRKRHSHPRSQPQEGDGLGTQAGRPAGGLPVSSTRRPAPAWPTATRSSAPAAATAKARSSSKSRPDKKVVWVLQDWANLGPATAVQILDDPGIPENPGDSQH